MVPYRTVQSQWTITWSRHASHSGFQPRCQQRKKGQRQTNKFLQYCTITTKKNKWVKTPLPHCWRTGRTEKKVWVGNFTGSCISQMDNSWVTLQTRHSQLTTDSWPIWTCQDFRVTWMKPQRLTSVEWSWHEQEIKGRHCLSLIIMQNLFNSHPSDQAVTPFSTSLWAEVEKKTDIQLQQHKEISRECDSAEARVKYSRL